MRISDWSSDVCSSDLGATELRDVSESISRQAGDGRGILGQLRIGVGAVGAQRQGRYGLPDQGGLDSLAARGGTVTKTGSAAERDRNLDIVPVHPEYAHINRHIRIEKARLQTELVICNRIRVEGGRKAGQDDVRAARRSEEHTSELQSLMRISY